MEKTRRWIAANRQPARQIIEKAELLDQPDVGFARPRAVAPAQFEQRRAQRLGHAPRLQMLVSDHVAGEEREHGADLVARGIAILVAVKRRDLPNLDVVAPAAARFGAR